MKLVLCRSVVSLIALFVAGLLLNCSSRLRLDLAITEAGVAHRLKVDQTQFAPRTVLGDPTSDTQIGAGDANCVVVQTSTRSRLQSPSGKYDVLRYDEVLQYRVFLQLPPEITTGRWPLTDHAFVQIMGRYELPKEEKLFAEASGTMAVDSLSGKRVYMSLDGEFKNPQGATLEISGQFRVKIK